MNSAGSVRVRVSTAVGRDPVPGDGQPARNRAVEGVTARQDGVGGERDVARLIEDELASGEGDEADGARLEAGDGYFAGEPRTWFQYCSAELDDRKDTGRRFGGTRRRSDP